MNMIQILKQVNKKNKFSIFVFSLINIFIFIFFFKDLRHQCFLNGQEYDLTIVDNAGSDQYTLSHIDFENSDAYVLVYAIDDLQRFFFLLFFSIFFIFYFIF